MERRVNSFSILTAVTAVMNGCFVYCPLRGPANVSHSAWGFKSHYSSNNKYRLHTCIPAIAAEFKQGKQENLNVVIVVLLLATAFIITKINGTFFTVFLSFLVAFVMCVRGGAHDLNATCNKKCFTLSSAAGRNISAQRKKGFTH